MSIMIYINTYVMLVNEKGIKIILGVIYIRPALMQDSTSAVIEQFNDIDNALVSILNIKTVFS